MISFLFWNLNQNSLQEIVSRLAARHEVDVLMLTECSIEPNELLTNLNQQDKPKYQYAPGYACERVEIFTRFSSEFIKPVYESDRLTIRHLNLPRSKDILLAVIHFPSKLYWSEPSYRMRGTCKFDKIC
jgi:hypothetical protein